MVDHPNNNKALWVCPYITVVDVQKAVNFYERAFGFEILNLAPGEDGTPWHAETNYKDHLIMFGKEGVKNCTSKAPLSSNVECPITLYLYCEDVDGFYEKALREGARSSQAPEDMFWGDRMCRLMDLDNYGWCFATRLTS